ncbi:MAG: Gfo/Idh/MocA family oxidoreductase [Spirochaetes bacterium]|nr:Gfo/Idh/MocA family oxidoreductase [Spirochaetota bacterium]
MDMIQIGIIGVSGHAKEHLRAIAYCEEQKLCRLAAAVIKPDADYKEYADGFRAKGVRVYREYAEMFTAERGTIDLIAIPTGIAFHEEHSVAALESGFNVLCEKPVAGTVAEAVHMKTAAEQTGKMLAIGYQYISSPMVQRVKQYTVNGTLGRMLSARTMAFGARDAIYYTRNAWAGKLSHLGKTIYDSPIQNAFAHFLMNMLYVASAVPGEGARVASVLMENYHAKDIESADTQSLLVTTSEQIPLCFLATHACEHHESVTEYHYEHGRIVWTPARTDVYTRNGNEEKLVDTLDNGNIPIQTLVFIDALNAIRNSCKPACTISTAMQQTIAIEHGFASSGGVKAIDKKYTSQSHRLKRPEGLSDTDAARYNTVINDIVPAMKNAFAADETFSDAQLPWAVPGKVISI